MQILVIRHAPAEDAIFPGGSDASRPLTAKGRKLFVEFAERFIKPANSPDLLLYSPLTRTVQTAELLAKVCELSPEQQRVESLLAPGATVSRIIPTLQSLQSLHFNRLALVGHNPDVGMIASRLIGGGAFDFKKGSVACIEFTDEIAPGLGRLVWFASPKLMAKD